MAAMEQEQRSLRIPISSSNDFVEIFPDEIPNDVNSLLDVLRAEYAPLKIWRAAALEYYRQNQLENFSEVLNEIVSAMDPQIEDYYRQRGEFEEGIVEIFDALASFSLYQSYSIVEDPQHAPESSQKLEALKVEIVANIKKSEGVNRRNEYTWMIRGFYELSYGDLEHADHYLRNVYDRALKQNVEKRLFLYGSTLGLGAVAYAKKKYSLALDFFVKAIQCNPLKCGNNVRVALATCCFKLEQYERARLAVDRVLSLDPCNVDALLILSLLQRIESGKVEVKRKKEYFRVARDLCALITQLDPSSALGLNQMANYKFDDWQAINMDVRVTSTNVIDVLHSGSQDFSSIENLKCEDMFKLKRGLTTLIVQEVTTTVNSGGVKNTTIVVNSSTEIPPDCVGKTVVLTCVKSKSDLNDVCRIAYKALRGSNVKEIRAESFYILGRVYHLLSQFDNAMKCYEDALSEMPEMSLASFGIGQLYLAKEEFELSYQNFQEVLKKYPDDRDTHAYMLFILSYHRKETATFDRLKEVAPGFVFEADLWLSQGHAMHQKGPGEYAKSLRCYEMAYSVMQEQGIIPHHHVLLNMGVLYHAVGNLEKAMHYTRLSLRACDKPFRENEQGEQSPVKPNAIFLEARNDIFYSWDIVPELEVTVVALPDLAKTPSGVSGGVYSCLSVTAGEVLAVPMGTFILVDGVLLVVEEVLSSQKLLICRGMIALTVAPTTFSVQKKMPRFNCNNDTIAHCFNLARIHEDTGQTQAAIEVYQQLLKLHPSFLECYLRLSMISSDLGRKLEALQWIERGMALDKNNVDATVVFGDLYCQMEDWEQAKFKFEKICKERHHDARSFLSLGNLYFANISTKESYLKDSLKFYHGVLKDDPRNLYAANGLGMVCAMEGKSEASRDIFSRGRETKMLPPSNDIVTNLGHVHLQQGRYVEAIRIYENVLKTLPNMPCSTHCSQSSSNLRRPDKASGGGTTLRHLPSASYSAISDCLSLAHFKHKQHKDAIKVQLKSLHADPSQIHVWYNLAYTKEELAVASLMKPHKTALDIEYAIGEIDKAQTLFSAMSNERFLANSAKHRSYKPEKAEEHASFCNANLEKFRLHLEKVQEQEDRKKAERSEFLAEQKKRAEDKERARMEVIEEQNRIKALRLEKAKQKQAILEESWQSTVGSQVVDPNASEKKQKKKKGSKGGAKIEDGVDTEKEESGVGELFDKMEDDSSGDEQEVQAMFDSEDEKDEEKEGDDEKMAEDREKVKDVFGSDSSDDEEEFDAETDGLASSTAASATTSNGRLKRALESSDDEGEFDLGEGEEGKKDKRGSSVPEGDDAGGSKRRKVIDDDDDEE